MVITWPIVSRLLDRSFSIANRSHTIYLNAIEQREQRVAGVGGSRGVGRSIVEAALGEGATVRVLDLETLIAVKEEIGGEKDRAVLPILRRTLEESRWK